MRKAIVFVGLCVTVSSFGRVFAQNPNRSVYVDLNTSDVREIPQKKEKTAPKSKPKGSEESVEKLEAESFRLINEARKSEGVPPVVLNEKLCKLARTYAKRMLDEKFFAHVDPSGKDAQTRASDAGVVGGVYENIGWQSGDDSSMEKIKDLHKSFMSEPKNEQNHRYIILHPKHLFVGVGVAKSGDEVSLAQEFTDQNPDGDLK